MNWLQQHLLTLVVAALPIGLFASLAFQWIKRQSAWVDAQNPLIKQGAIVLIATLVTTVSSALGAPVVCEEGINCLTQLDQGTLATLIQAALSLGVAKLTHKSVLQKKKG